MSQWLGWLGCLMFGHTWTFHVMIGDRTSRVPALWLPQRDQERGGVMPIELDDRTIEALRAANDVLYIIAPRTWIIRDKGGWYVEWKRSNGETMRRRWARRNGSHYPSWYRHWGHGGTCTLALSQLIRWVQGKPVVPLSSWHHWCGDRIYLARDKGAEVCSRLSDAGWPHGVPCVLCGTMMVRAGDWWDLNGNVGPCCGMTSGCRQQQALKTQREQAVKSPAG